MCFRVSRSTGAISGHNFKFRPNNWQEDLPALKKADEDGLIINYTGMKYKIRINTSINNNNVDKITAYIDSDEQSWCDFNAKNEINKLDIFKKILYLSEIENGEILPWGMVNYYYDSRDGCSYLIIYYNLDDRAIPDPIYNYDILP